MKGLKNFLYDKNDIVIALVILLLAGLLIFWRMEVIMAYPQTLATETNTTTTTEEEAEIDEEATDAGETSKEKAKSGDASGSVFADGVLTKDVTVTVAGGSATAAVESLVSAGLFASYDEYVQICNAAGYTPENIKATTFTFEAGSTQTDIAKKVTA